ncbi:Acetylornithine aminotransferase, mitochondrial [Zancudomyces culisetae]|uniref:acetylornithine transaminase n=1 Tax=Zancudomyces culisetae TaxID=1213189 RepID=A0A1R1PEP5_ZANCU|nr:Acetylornithine aminotransferase, mitochondrial [Zancudomyces culisetae]OMH82678.1 Acetylornithine aminotransferase, mitochondrial [Zancudomyces culisetae]OMH84535.1 Acetylornithine aminotransferase, mitochondrial [Zancudomyces culisetae]|eukprot:OMH79383.1 Acetylornithine aminotransferase, mitochondrial [Zancudomyces culisetae]
MLNTYKKPERIFTRGNGVELYDTEGNSYIDFTAGIAVVALGHGNKEVAKILYEQAQNVVHLSNLYYNKEAGELAKEMVDTTLQQYEQGTSGIYAKDEQGGPKVFFSNSGTEANEGALKIARKYGKLIAAERNDGMPADLKSNIVCFTNAFHGRSMGALSVTPNPKYQNSYSPLIPNVTVARFNDTTELNTIIDDRTCAVIVEPLQGEGGINIATENFLKAVRNRCTQSKAVLIYDEIQCGLGRTGKLWGHQNYSPQTSPDIITCAKPLANGVPIGAIIVSSAISKAINPGDHGTTFGGNPLACSVGRYVFKTISKPEFLQDVKAKGEYLTTRLNEICKPYLNSSVINIRGKGLIIGVQFKDNKITSEIVKKAMDSGLLLVEASNNTIRFVPPLIITKDEIDQAIGILEKVMKEVI